MRNAERHSAHLSMLCVSVLFGGMKLYQVLIIDVVTFSSTSRRQLIQSTNGKSGPRPSPICRKAETSTGELGRRRSCQGWKEPGILEKFQVFKFS